MRAALCLPLALAAIAALSAASWAHPASCATKADQTAIAAHSKASSFAPHGASQNRVYGVPIQSRILKSKPKKSPQLKSAPLPES